MCELFTLLYIEIGDEYKDIFFALIVAAVFISMVIIACRMNKNGIYTMKSSVDSVLPASLLRVCVAEFIHSSDYSYEDIKEKYIRFFKKLGMHLPAELKYEAEQLKFLVVNKIVVRRSIMKGKKEKHKKKLLIIAFFLNFYASQKDIKIIAFTDQLRRTLNISDSVYYKLSERYIQNSEKETENSFSQFKKAMQINRAYKTLHVQNGAGLAEVKEAYRKLAKLYHPDVQLGVNNKQTGSAQKFTQISDAYNVLKNVLE